MRSARTPLFVVAALMLVTALPSSLAAFPLVLQNGPHYGYTVNPFDSISGTTRYQQVYASSAFSGPVTIQALAFSPNYSGLYRATVTIRFTTTTLGVNALGTSLDSNYVKRLTTVFSGTVSQYVTAGQDGFGLVFDFSSTPFAYNPADGNLLVDIQVSNQQFDQSYFSVSYAYAGSVSSVAYNSAVFGNMLGNLGLRTMLFAQTPVTPRPTLSNEQGPDVLRVGVGQPYATIGSAVRAAEPGSTILVYPGTYREMVPVRKDGLKFLAQGSDVLVVPAVLDPTTGHLRTGAAFTVLADHVTIQGFEIEYALASPTHGVSCQIAIDFRGSYTTIADNYMYARPGGACPGVTPLASPTRTGGSNFNVVERNIIDTADVGMAIGASRGLNIGNVVRDNTFLHIAQTGIAITNGSWFEVSGNTVRGTTLGPCVVVGADTNDIPQGHHLIANNTLSHCASNGITLYANPGTVVTHNWIVGNAIASTGEDGIQLYMDRATLSDNTVASNQVSGAVSSGVMLTAGANYNRVLGNRIGPDNGVGITVAGDGNWIVGNFLLRNGTAYQDLGAGNTWLKNKVSTTK